MSENGNMRQDRRVAYTKSILKEALLEIMRSGKSINDINISELCRMADINRKTFYKHYSSPEELLMEIEEDCLAEYQTFLSDQSLDSMVYHIIRAIYENEKFYYLVIASGENNKIFHMVISSSYQEMQERAVREGVEIDKRKMDYGFHYLAGGAREMILTWLQNGMNESPEYISELLLEFIRGNVSKLEQALFLKEQEKS